MSAGLLKEEEEEINILFKLNITNGVFQPQSCNWWHKSSLLPLRSPKHQCALQDLNTLQDQSLCKEGLCQDAGCSELCTGEPAAQAQPQRLTRPSVTPPHHRSYTATALAQQQRKLGPSLTASFYLGSSQLIAVLHLMLENSA